MGVMQSGLIELSQKNKLLEIESVLRYLGSQGGTEQPQDEISTEDEDFS